MAIGEAIGGAAAAAVATPINYYFESKAAEQNQQYYKENLAANFQLSQLAQRNAAGNEVSGLRAAGLSPALANGAAATPVPSAPQGTMKAPNVDPANLLLFAELKNLSAQTDKTKEETAKTKQETENLQTINSTNTLAYAHAKDLDATLSANMPQLFEEMSKDGRYPEHMRTMFADAAKQIREEGVTQGGLQGLEKYLSLRIEQKESLIKEMTTRFDWNLAIARLEDPQLIKTLVNMPTTERENLLALSGKYIQEVATLAQTAETEVSKREKIGAEIQKLTRETQKILHSDNAQMYKEKDAQGLMWSLAGSLAGATKDVITHRK